MSRRSRRRRHAGLVSAAALLPGVLLAGPVPAAAERTTAADGTTALPAVTQKLPAGTTRCRGASGARLTGVPWAEEYLAVRALTARHDGQGQTIGLVDTGVDLSGVPALAGRVRSLPPVYTRPVAAPDCVGHGTAMASLLLATGTGESGESGVHGLAPAAEIVSVDATDVLGNTDAEHLARAITALVAQRVGVIAVGTATVTRSAALDAALAEARRRDVLVVAPARFDAQTEAARVQPAASTGVLAVGDVGPGGAPPESVPAGAVVALAAPGDRVAGLGTGGRGEVTGSGPSYAVAYVAAAAALVRGAHPGLTAAQTADRLLRTATPPSAGAVPDPQLGYGVLDPAAAVDTVFDSPGAGPTAGGGHRAAAAIAGRPPHDDGVSTALVVGAGAVTVLVLAAGAGSAVGARRRRLAP